MNKLWFAILLIVAIAAAAIFSRQQALIHFDSDSQNTDRTLEQFDLTGSNTIGESFAPELAKAFLRSKGARLIQVQQLAEPVEKYVEGIIESEQKKIRINIQAHGSSTGFKSLFAQPAEIAMSSRRIKQDEQKQLTEQFSKVNEFPIALDALAIIAHPDLPLEQLSIVQIGKIFSAEISNWNQLGGPDQAIQLFSRDHNSGTWDTFKNLVLKPSDKKLSPDSARLESSQALVDRVNTTPGAIGFVGVAYTEKSKLLKVTAEENEEGSTPSRYTIGTQNYPLSRKLYLYTTGEDTSILGKEFIEFVTTNAGQKLAEKAGLISYYPTRSQPEKLDKLSPPRYRELSAMANRISVDFAANLNHADLAKEERDIQRLLNFIKQNQHRKIVLVDFVSSPRIIDLASRLNQQGIPVLDTMQLINDKAEHRNIEVWVL